MKKHFITSLLVSLTSLCSYSQTGFLPTWPGGTANQYLSANAYIKDHLVFNSPFGVIDWGSGTSGDLIFRTLQTQGYISPYTDRVVFKNNGFVGIGNPAGFYGMPQDPTDQLHVRSKNNNGITISQHGTGSSKLTLQVFSTSKANSLNTNSLGDFVIRDENNGIDRLYLRQSNGALGINNTNPVAYLHLISPPAGGTGLIVEHTSTSVGYGQITRIKNNGSKAFVIENTVAASFEPFIIYGDGRTRIGDQFTQVDYTAKLAVDSKVQIGSALKTTSPHYANYLLSVKGKGVFQEIIVTNQLWADFVFDNDYKLRSLSEVEAYYKENHHLPEIPTAKEVEEKGVSVGEMNKLLLQKIEELTIYLVEQNNAIGFLKEKIQKLEEINK